MLWYERDFLVQNWLFASGLCQLSHDFERGERIDFAGGGVRAYMEEVDVLPGVSLYRIDATGTGHFELAKNDTPAGGRLVLGCMLGGSGSLSMEGCEEQVWREEGRFYSLTPVRRAVHYDVRSNPYWRVVAIRLEANALSWLMQDNGLPDLVRDTLEGRVSDVAMAGPMTGPMRHLMGDLLRPTYSGAMRRLYQQSKAMELLVHQFDMLGGYNASGELGGRELARIREARERLVCDLRDPPSLDELAAAVGLSPKRLNAGFRSVFGTTVFDLLRDARLDLARELLDQELAVPLKVLAWQVGYTQPTNFITAFRRRFGVSPGAYRRKNSKG